MTRFESATMALAIFTAILLPTHAFMVRRAIKWAQVETKVDNLIVVVQELVIKEDKVHLSMLEQMREDRTATDKRLRWLEEYLWRKGDKDAV